MINFVRKLDWRNKSEGPPQTIVMKSDLLRYENGIGDLSDLVDTGRLAESELNGTYAPARVESVLPFAPASTVSSGAFGGTDPIWVDAFDGHLYGYRGSTLYRTTARSAPWQAVHEFPAGSSITAVRKTGDGEVLVAQAAGGVWRSSGWTNPLNATWTKVLTTNAEVRPFGFNVDETSGWVAATTYIPLGDMSLSRYVWLSKDHGRTWSVIYDKSTQHPEVAAETSHFHTVAFDPWISATRPRIWIVWHKTASDPTNAADPKHFVIFSDDGGATWNEFSTAGDHPVVMIATPEGMVCDTDNAATGASLMLIDRKAMTRKRIYRRRTSANVTGLWAWGAKAVKGTAPNTWHFMFRSVEPGAPAGIITTDGRRATETVTMPSATASDTVEAVHLTVHNGELLATGIQTVTAPDARQWFAAGEPMRGEPGMNNLDGLSGGTADDQSIAAGTGAVASAYRGVAVGHGASVVRDSVGVGFAAMTTAERSVAVGAGAVSAIDGVVVGAGVKATGSQITLIGSGASAASRSVCVGYNATVNSTDGTSVGALSKSGQETVSIGKSAGNTTTQSVFVGAGTTSTGAATVAIGYSSSTAGSDSTAVGWTATGGTRSTSVGREAGNGGDPANYGGGSDYVAVGYRARSVSNGVAIGSGTSATGTGGAVAIGRGATAGHTDSIAIGNASATSANLQVQLGARHMELTEVTGPAAPAADKARLYVRDDGSGETRLYIRTATSERLIS